MIKAKMREVNTTAKNKWLSTRDEHKTHSHLRNTEIKKSNTQKQTEIQLNKKFNE